MIKKLFSFILILHLSYCHLFAILDGYDKQLTNQQLEGNNPVVKLLLHMEAGTGTSAYDNSSNNRIGSMTGVVWTKNNKIGEYGTSWDGVNDDITFGNSSDWHLGSEDFTIMAWINHSNTGAISFLSRGYSGSDRAWVVQKNQDEQIRFFYSTTGSDSNNFGSGAGNTLAEDTWYHVAVTGDSSFFKIYINGEFMSQAARVTIFDNADPLLVGCVEIGSQEWDGLLDEIILIKGEAYTQAKILHHIRKQAEVYQ
jgi:hypothetical protein